MFYLFDEFNNQVCVTGKDNLKYFSENISWVESTSDTFITDTKRITVRVSIKQLIRKNKNLVEKIWLN